MGELLIEESCADGGPGNGYAVDRMNVIGGPWSVERRFRVTEVFLAVLWVWLYLPSFMLAGQDDFDMLRI